MTDGSRTAIVAVGGNSLIVDEQHQSIPDQFNAAAKTSHYVADMVEAGWTVVDPVLDVWRALPARSFPNYAAGSWGPKEADDLLANDGRQWRQDLK